MLHWLRRRFRSARTPVTGVPGTRRLKTYSAESGHAYQYVFAGARPVAGGAEYHFAVTANRSAYRPLVVQVPDAALESWEQAHGRRLAGNERYAIAKLGLLALLDRCAAPPLPESLVITAEQVAESAGRLALE